jgi:hypothetical protein
MRTNNISKGIIGTARKLANRWADSDSLKPSSSLVARRSTKVIMRMPKTNLSTYRHEVYTQTSYLVNAKFVG